MPVRSCYFIVEEDGTFSRMPKDTFFRIIQQREDELHPEFKGRRVKYAQIDVQYEGRRPLAVHDACFRHLLFDQHGRFDNREFLEIAQSIVQQWDIPKIDDADIDRPPTGAPDDEIEEKFGWRPAQALRDQLYEAALHNQMIGGYRH